MCLDVWVTIYNYSNEIGRGFPYPMKNESGCRVPILKAPEYYDFWPVGFDPVNPQCYTYVLPWVWIPAGLIVFGQNVLELDLLVEQYPRLKWIPSSFNPFSLLVYNTIT